MLELLARYARDQDLDAEPGFKPKDVRWAIVADGAGHFLDVVELGDAADRRNPGHHFSKCPDLSHGELIAGGVTRSHFLVETVEVVASLGGGDSDSKAARKHEYFIWLLHQASVVAPELGAVAAILEDPACLEEVRRSFTREKAKPPDKVTLVVDGAFPLESTVWHDWWRSFRQSLGGEPSPIVAAGSVRCLATGNLVVPAATHPKVEKLNDVGGLPTGDVLVGFDKDAFCSYGLSKSANAAVSENAAAAYRAALNDLIRNHSHRLAGAKVIHWFKMQVPSDDDALAWLDEGGKRQEMTAQESARRLLEGIRSGERGDLARNHFYALTVSGAAGRVMVRDWMEGPFQTLVQNIHDWFDDLSITHRDGRGTAPDPKLMAVLGATVRDLDELRGPFVAKMWRAAVGGEPIPQAALAKAVARWRVDMVTGEAANHARMGLLKAYHVRNHRLRGEGPVPDELRPHLNDAHPSPAYQCGRLMAVFAELQRSALGDVGAGVVQRYYASASTTPSLVLGRLARSCQFHLNKLESGGLAHWYEDRLAGVWARLGDELPRILDLEGQSMFALGYYQQLASMRAGKSADSTTEGNQHVA
jgi:CRISPR-associated protein Csd1